MKLWFQLADGQIVHKESRLDRVLGRKCTLRRSVQNASFHAPIGSWFVITAFSHHSGWELARPEPCTCCKLTPRVHGVDWEAVLIEGPVPAPPSKAALEAARLTGGNEAAEQMEQAWKRDRRYYHDYGDDD